MEIARQSQQRAYAHVQNGLLQSILADKLRSPAISALLLGFGLFARPDAVFSCFYEPLFRGVLSIFMLIMGTEA